MMIRMHSHLDRSPRSIHRRHALALVASTFFYGCVPNRSTNPGPSELIIGQRGLADGRFQKPRAMAISPSDEIYVIDKTARIQVFNAAGEFLRGWKTPEGANGKPTGASIDPATGNLLVADTHYFRFLTYTPKGELLTDKTIGGVNGSEPGQFGWVTDIARAPDGTLYLAEYGEFDQIYKYSPDGQYIDRFGEHGDAPLQFSRPQTLAVDEAGLLWISDACNHRIQVVDWRDKEPKSIAVLGGEGTEPGQLMYPYGMKLISGDRLLVSEFGGHRVQCWRRDGTPISSWGTAGSAAGELNQPWAVDTDSRGRVYVVDSGNNRVQRFSLT
jgi:DNA-binding beta-propeller fold protein YncE